jgi:ribA/ribD-fused uncharacterized protein
MINEFRGKYFFLSNFYHVPYPSNEHYFQAAKATNDKDREFVMSAPDAKTAKARGGKNGIKCRPDWNEIRISVMEDFVRIKFQDAELRQQLLDTGDEELVEGNWWGDIFWGVCKGEGENHLGKILMKIRAEIRAELKGGRV